jgi:cytochrome P450
MTEESQVGDNFSALHTYTFAKIPLARQLAASEAMADHLMATDSVDPEISRNEIVEQCHTLLLALPDSAFF